MPEVWVSVLPVITNLSFLWTWFTPLTVILFVGACAGHIAIQVYLLNCFLGFPTPKQFSRWVRKANTFLVFVGPVLLWLTFAVGLWELADSIGGKVWLVYVLLCWIVGFAAAPLLQIHYWWHRRTSPLVLTNDSRIIDIAKELGFRPIGRGRHRRLALLPWNEIYQVEFAEKHLQIPGLPDVWEGLTILHLTDLHFKGVPDKIFFQKVMDHCVEKWEPDLVALTGDIVDSEEHHRWMLPLLGKLRWGIEAFAILGNHDQWFEPNLIRRRLRRLGMIELGNSWREIDVRGRPMIVIGNECPWFTPETDLTECPDGFRLCLSHTPDNIEWAKKNNINLMLSGHNHGGQIRFPLIGSVYVPSRYSRRYDCGVFYEAPTVLHVGRGLAGQHPVRYGCRPEITLLVLHKKSE